MSQGPSKYLLLLLLKFIVGLGFFLTPFNVTAGDLDIPLGGEGPGLPQPICCFMSNLCA